VQIESAAADATELAEAIKESGYTPVPVKPEVAAAQPAKAGGCCGCCR
jgi:copper chaperone